MYEQSAAGAGVRKISKELKRMGVKTMRVKDVCTIFVDINGVGFCV